MPASSKIKFPAPYKQEHFVPPGRLITGQSLLANVQLLVACLEKLGTLADTIEKTRWWVTKVQRTKLCNVIVVGTNELSGAFDNAAIAAKKNNAFLYRALYRRGKSEMSSLGNKFRQFRYQRENLINQIRDFAHHRAEDPDLGEFEETLKALFSDMQREMQSWLTSLFEKYGVSITLVESDHDGGDGPGGTKKDRSTMCVVQ